MNEFNIKAAFPALLSAVLLLFVSCSTKSENELRKEEFIKSYYSLRKYIKAEDREGLRSLIAEDAEDLDGIMRNTFETAPSLKDILEVDERYELTQILRYEPDPMHDNAAAIVEAPEIYYVTYLVMFSYDDDIKKWFITKCIRSKHG